MRYRNIITKCSALGLYTLLFFSCKHDQGLTDLGDINAIGNNGVIKPTVDSTSFLRLNEIQVIASHNSYRVKTDAAIFDFVQNIKSLLPSSLDPDGWDYSHLPIPEQLGDYQVRGLELDIFNDPNGGQFYNRQGNILVQKPIGSGIQELQQPGFKMLHIPDLDYNTNYYSFKSGIQALKDWSDSHPNHIPIFVNIETKDETPASYVTSALPFPVPGLVFTQAIPYDAAAVLAFDAEIKEVFGSGLEKVFTPDELRGTFPTLRDAAMAGNWPMLKDMRGKIVFIMEGACVDTYLGQNENLEGRVSFVYAGDIQSNYSAFVILNNPVSDQSEIQEAVTKGFIVRTRSDSDTDEARTGDYTNRDAAVASGAQIISTDYYRPDPRSSIPGSGWTDFHVELPGGKMFRINPVVAPQKLAWGELSE